MFTTTQINNYINGLNQPKQNEIKVLHNLFLELFATEKLWFLDGKNETGKIVSNPNIGYGMTQIQSANGTSKAFYKVGISANTGGISVYIMGLKDKNLLKNALAQSLGKALVSSYCIKFKSLKDIDCNVLRDFVHLHL